MESKFLFSFIQITVFMEGSDQSIIFLSHFCSKDRNLVLENNWPLFQYGIELSIFRVIFRLVDKS